MKENDIIGLRIDSLDITVRKNGGGSALVEMRDTYNGLIKERLSLNPKQIAFLLKALRRV